MGWEKRGNRLYYYRPRKVRGRVVREYVGAGVVGRFAELVDEQARDERESREAACRAERERLEQLDAPLVAYSRAVDVLLTDALIEAGCYQHHREWRRRSG